MSAVVEPPSIAQRSATIARPLRLAERVVCVGGLPGCGKTLMTQIVGSLANVEIERRNYTLDHLCGLYRLGRLDDDVVTAMIRLQVDMNLYDMSMSRETNFRFSDQSSVFRNPAGWRYLWRLVQSGDASAVQRIRTRRPILQLMMHNVLALSPALFLALGDTVRILELVRHPLYMVKQWFLYINQYGTEARNFTIWLDYRGHALPFFAHGWEEQYLQSNPMDRCIYAMDRLTQWGHQALEGLSPAARSCVLRVPFERFVLDPWPHLDRIEHLLDTRRTWWTRVTLRQQHVPRRRIADGPALAIYRRYGWEPAQRQSNETDELRRRRAFVAQHASSDGLHALDRLTADYESRYLGWGLSR